MALTLPRGSIFSIEAKDLLATPAGTTNQWNKVTEHNRTDFSINVERIEKTQEVYEKNSIKLNKYGVNIQNYITGNVVFTISDFASVNNISYNTAKKYLKELVIEEILVPIKISKHNAFVYTDVYNIWLK